MTKEEYMSQICEFFEKLWDSMHPTPPGEVIPPDDPSTHPKDWENAAYLYKYRDAQPPIVGSGWEKNPYGHYLKWGQPAGWTWKPEGWDSATYLQLNKDVANAGAAPLLHWWQYGEGEGRIYKYFTPPTEKGLHNIYFKQDQREIFSVLPHDGFLALGDYGLNVGGASFREWNNGKSRNEVTFQDCESVFDLYVAADNNLLCTNEHFAYLRKQVNGIWQTKHKTNNVWDLMFYIRRAGERLYANYMTFDQPKGGVLEGDLNGDNWTVKSAYNGKVMMGMHSDGKDIVLAGKSGSYQGPGCPILTDIFGNIICSKHDLDKYLWWPVTKYKGNYIMGTCAGYNIPSAVGYIHLFDGSNVITVYSTTRNCIHRFEVIDDVLYCVASQDWASRENSLLLRSVDGYRWNIICEIPGHVIGTRVADGGIYMTGGLLKDHGRVSFYRP